MVQQCYTHDIEKSGSSADDDDDDGDDGDDGDKNAATLYLFTFSIFTCILVVFVVNDDDEDFVIRTRALIIALS